MHFTPDEEEIIYELAAQLTGTNQESRSRRDVIVTNIARRLAATRSRDLDSYLSLTERSDSEFDELISALTIHTTSWFREFPHFELVEERIREEFSLFTTRPFRLLCPACSTGQEVYSFALLLEHMRQLFTGFDYQIVGSDIDPVSIRKARDAVYPIREVQDIPEHYRKHLLSGSGASAGLFAMSEPIRSRCSFKVCDLREVKRDGSLGYDQIICRNVLIYFKTENIKTIVEQLSNLLEPGGIVCVGHSEALDPTDHNMNSVGKACYRKPGKPNLSGKGKAHRVLVIDDSLTVRKTLLQLFPSDEFSISEAASAEEATEVLKKREVDLITLDLNLPGLDGASWLKMQRSKGLRVPVIVLSGASPEEALGVLGALENGAQDFIEKNVLRGSKEDLLARIRSMIESYHQRGKSKAPQKAAPPQNVKLTRPDLIVIGASTGGTEVLSKLMKSFSKQSPPVLIVQHITPSFAKPFAERIAEVSGLRLVTPVTGAKIENGCLYMAFSDQHIEVRERNDSLVLGVSESMPVNRHKPSVDVLFQSVAAINGINVLAALLTGMGADGAAGLLALRQKGAITMAQDEHSSIVFGMPKEAIRLGAAQFVEPPDKIRSLIDQALSAKSARSSK